MATYITKKSDDYSLLDKHTGEILEYRQTKKLSMDEFIMVFFSSYPQLLRLKGTQLKVLMCCWKQSTFNDDACADGNLVHNNATFKDYCRADGLELSNAAIDNAISFLAKEGLLIKKCRGEYLLNPKYFFKGTLSKRSHIQYNFVVEPETKSTDYAFFMYGSSSCTLDLEKERK